MSLEGGVGCGFSSGSNNCCTCKLTVDVSLINDCVIDESKLDPVDFIGDTVEFSKPDLAGEKYFAFGTSSSGFLGGVEGGVILGFELDKGSINEDTTSGFCGLFAFTEFVSGVDIMIAFDRSSCGCCPFDKIRWITSRIFFWFSSLVSFSLTNATVELRVKIPWRIGAQSKT